MEARPYLLALAAGLLAALNPCGFAMLPAYLGLLLGTGDPDGPRSTAARIRRAASAAGAMTAGFMLVFGGFGLLVVPLALSVERFLPWITVVVGTVLVVVALTLLSGREVAVRLPRPAWAPGGSALSWVGYGTAYALASLSCTVGPFLALTATTFRTASLAAGVGVFLAYALGMGLLVGALSIGVAVAHDGLLRRVRQVGPVVARISGGLLLVTACYVVWYGLYEIRVLGGGVVSDPVVDAALGVQRALVRQVDRVGATVLAGVFAGLLGLVALGLLATRSAVAARGQSAARREARAEEGTAPR